MLHRKSCWVMLVLLLTLGALSALDGKLPRAAANVTLIRFAAESLNGLPEVYVEWETATEIDTAGFYVQRSLTNEANSYTRVSAFVPHEGDNITGAVYDWLDETTVLNTTYYYRLEEIPTDAGQPSVLYDPVSVVAGVSPTKTPTPTPPALIYLPLIWRGN